MTRGYELNHKGIFHNFGSANCLLKHVKVAGMIEPPLNGLERSGVLQLVSEVF
jgi:hypothetical protein